MALFMHIFYLLLASYLVFAIIVLISNKLAKFLLNVLFIIAVLAVASIIIMGCWALIIFLSGVIM